MPPLTPHAIPAGTLGRSGQPELRADGGLVLRPWAPADAPALAGLYADPAVQHWHGYTISTQDEAVTLIEGWHERWLTERAACWALVAGPDGSFAGQAGLLAIDLRGGSAECFYSTAPALRGRGVAPSALEALASWAFLAGFHRLYLRHSVANPASCRVALKSGFEAEGTERGAELHTDGWHDMHLHARIATLLPLSVVVDQPSPIVMPVQVDGPPTVGVADGRCLRFLEGAVDRSSGAAVAGLLAVQR
jgi:RimJ/RimL family protein N-acetyltransferase